MGQMLPWLRLKLKDCCPQCLICAEENVITCKERQCLCWNITIMEHGSSHPFTTRFKKAVKLLTCKQSIMQMARSECCFECLIIRTSWNHSRHGLGYSSTRTIWIRSAQGVISLQCLRLVYCIMSLRLLPMIWLWPVNPLAIAAFRVARRGACVFVTSLCLHLWV